jgi:hypothetical protein
MSAQLQSLYVGGRTRGVPIHTNVQTCTHVQIYTQSKKYIILRCFKKCCIVQYHKKPRRGVEVNFRVLSISTKDGAE